MARNPGGPGRVPGTEGRDPHVVMTRSTAHAGRRARGRDLGPWPGRSQALYAVALSAVSQAGVTREARDGMDGASLRGAAAKSDLAFFVVGGLPALLAA